MAFAEYISLEFSNGVIFPKIKLLDNYGDFPKWLFQAINHIRSSYQSLLNNQNQAS